MDPHRPTHFHFQTKKGHNYKVENNFPDLFDDEKRREGRFKIGNRVYVLFGLPIIYEYHTSGSHSVYMTLYIYQTSKVTVFIPEY